MHYDVFNGDADGIIALLQLRLSQPLESRLITGVKRDISLLNRVYQQDDVSSVVVLDISLDKNYIQLESLLSRKINVFYCDHHQANHKPISPYLTSLIDLDSETCTSLIINDYLGARYVNWAIAAAFGDNLLSKAYKIAKAYNLSQEDTEYLRQLGMLINYNGYGAEIADLHYHPKDLYLTLLNYSCPFLLRDDSDSPYYHLKTAYLEDTAQVDRLKPIFESTAVKVFELPEASWARRVSGVFSNELANQSPHLAHAVLTLNKGQQDYSVSVRAPLMNRFGADDVCSMFSTGGGRKAAAGINQLPIIDKEIFIQRLHHFYQVS